MDSSIEQRLGHHIEQTIERERIGLDLLEQLGDGEADEVLLAFDAAEVGTRVGLPVAVAELLVVAAAGVGEGLCAVEGLAARVELQPGVGVLRGVVDADLDAADGVHEALEADEVDLDVVVDRDAQTFGDRPRRVRRRRRCRPS